MQTRAIVRKASLLYLFLILMINNQPAMAATGYRYVYFRWIDYQHFIITSLDMSGISRVVTLDPRLPPDRTFYSLNGAQVGPTGEWVLLCFGYQDRRRDIGHGTELILFNPITTEFRHVVDGNFALWDCNGTADGHIVWSLDGQQIAFSAIQPVIEPEIDAGIYLYDISEKSLVPVIFGIDSFSRMAFSRDSRSLVISRKNCTDANDQHCRFALEIFDVASRGLKQHVNMPYYEGPLGQASMFTFDAVCLLTWSPNDRYISLLPQCGRMEQLGRYEVYVWDTSTGDIGPITNFMATMDYQANTSPYALYSTEWMSADTLIIGAIWGLPTVSFNTQTITIKFPDEILSVVSQEMVEEVVINPNTDDIAYRSVSKIDASNLWSDNHMVSIGHLYHDSLQPRIDLTLPNGCYLNWSPDGAALAYLAQRGGSIVNRGCDVIAKSSLTEFILVDNTSGREVKFPYPDYDDRTGVSIILGGWMRIQ